MGNLLTPALLHKCVEERENALPLRKIRVGIALSALRADVEPQARRYKKSRHRPRHSVPPAKGSRVFFASNKPASSHCGPPGWLR